MHILGGNVKIRKILSRPELVLYLALLVLIITLFIALPRFGTVQNISNILVRTVPLFAVSAGQTFVILAAGIDLSVGSVLALSTAIASIVMPRSIIGAIILIFVSGALIGSLNGLGVTKLNINPFVMTLGTMSIVGGLTLYIRPRPGGYIPREYVNTILARIGPIPLAPLLLLLVTIAAGVSILRKTRFGRYIYAVGGNEEAARLAGINTDLVKIGTYTASGLFAAFAGLYMTARIGCGDPFVGTPYLLDSIAVVVVGGASLAGGRGTMEGTIAGAIILGMLGNIFNLMDVDIYWQYVFRGIIVVGVAALSYLREIKSR